MLWHRAKSCKIQLSFLDPAHSALKILKEGAPILGALLPHPKQTAVYEAWSVLGSVTHLYRDGLRYAGGSRRLCIHPVVHKTHRCQGLRFLGR